MSVSHPPPPDRKGQANQPAYQPPSARYGAPAGLRTLSGYAHTQARREKPTHETDNTTDRRVEGSVAAPVYCPVESPRMETKLFFPQLCTSRLKSFENVAFSSTSFVAGCSIERVKVTWQLQSAASACGFAVFRRLQAFPGNAPPWPAASGSVFSH